ncbi:MAG TPA: alpha/beta fold hydrolase [Polyangiaceae bacterium]|jgi:proline iminopeptidase|nr:alpha/beta fold hydrolase [Polyangiaceae bacterium]
MNAVVKGICIAGAALVGSCAAVFVGSYLAYSGQYAVPATTLDDPALPSRSIGGYRYHLEVFGMPTMPVVVVVHGGPGGDYRYLSPLQALSDEYQVVFYDQRGSGLSPRVPAEQLSLGQAIDDLGAVIGSVSPHAPVRLLGHSWGAMLVAAYLDRHPEHVSHAVLAEPAFLTAERGRQWFDAIHQGRPPLSLQLLGGAWRVFVQSLYVYGPDDDARRDFLATGLLALDVPGHPLAAYFCGGDLKSARLPMWRAGMRAFDALGPASRATGGGFGVDLVGPNARRFPHKVLLLAGSCDEVLGPAAQKQNLAFFTNAELAVVEGAGHTMIGEQPEASLAILRRYLGQDHSAIVASD